MEVLVHVWCSMRVKISLRTALASILPFCFVWGRLKLLCIPALADPWASSESLLSLPLLSLWKHWDYRHLCYAASALFLRDRILLYNSGWPQTYRILPASAYWVLESSACTNTPGICMQLYVGSENSNSGPDSVQQVLYALCHHHSPTSFSIVWVVLAHWHHYHLAPECSSSSQTELHVHSHSALPPCLWQTTICIFLPVPMKLTTLDISCEIIYWFSYYI